MHHTCMDIPFSGNTIQPAAAPAVGDRSQEALELDATTPGDSADIAGVQVSRV